MSDTAIKFENISKQYRSGKIGTGTLSHDLKRWFTVNVRGKEDPYLKIGQENILSAHRSPHISSAEALAKADRLPPSAHRYLNGAIWGMLFICFSDIIIISVRNIY